MAVRQRYSYVRVAREVEPTEHVSNLFARLRDYSENLPVRKTIGINIAQSVDELKEQGQWPQVRPLEIRNIRFNDEDNLKVVYHEERLPRNQRTNSKLIRSLGFLSQIDFDNLTENRTPEVLPVDCHYVIDSTSRTGFVEKNYREFSLVLSEGDALFRLLQEQRALLSQMGRATRRDYRQLATDSDEIAVSELGIVPIFTVPRQTDAEAVDTYVDRINLDGLGKPLVTLNLMPPELQSKIR